MANIAVYCASSTPKDASLLTLAHTVGRDLARDGHTILFGGSKNGLMGALARGVHEANGTIWGFPVHAVTPHEPLFPGMNYQFCNSVPERLAHFRKQADAHILLPGGVVSVEEAFHMLGGISFKAWGLSLPEAMPRCPVGFVDHKLIRPLYTFLKNSHAEGLVHSDTFGCTHIAAWPVLHRWVNIHLGTHIPAEPIVA